MTTVSAKEAKERFGALIEAAQRGPVAIERHGRRVAVLVHAEEFDRLEALEDAYWGEKARAAAKKGFIGHAETAKYLTSVLNAKN